jgi:hypothetical protein
MRASMMKGRHTDPGCDIEGVVGEPFQSGKTQGINRRLRHRYAMGLSLRIGSAAGSRNRLLSPPLAKPRNSTPCIANGSELRHGPCGPTRSIRSPLAYGVPGGVGAEDRAGQRPLLAQVQPGLRARLQDTCPTPAHGSRRDRTILLPGRKIGRKGKGQPDIVPKELPDVAEIQIGSEMLNQGKDVALGGATWVPPPRGHRG